MAEPGQVVGGRQAARPGADHEHPLAAADRRRVEEPALLQREVAQEPLDRVDRDGAVEAGAVADALARVVADPPVDRGQRIVRDELDATPARAGPPGCATARPGCSRRPGSRRCTAAAGRRRPAGAPGPGRCGSARAAGPAAASRPASGRSCPSPRSDSHGSQANQIPLKGGVRIFHLSERLIRSGALISGFGQERLEKSRGTPMLRHTTMLASFANDLLRQHPSGRQAVRPRLQTSSGRDSWR